MAPDPLAALAVDTARVDQLSARVLQAAQVTEALAERPGALPEGLAASGSAALSAAAADFAAAWSRECSLLAHDTRLLGDAVATAAGMYRDVEWSLVDLPAALAPPPTPAPARR